MRTTCDKSAGISSGAKMSSHHAANEGPAVLAHSQPMVARPPSFFLAAYWFALTLRMYCTYNIAKHYCYIPILRHLRRNILHFNLTLFLRYVQISSSTAKRIFLRSYVEISSSDPVAH